MKTYQLEKKTTQPKKKSPVKLGLGCLFTLLFALTLLPILMDIQLPLFEISSQTLQIISIIELAIAFLCFLPAKKRELPTLPNRNLGKRTLYTALSVLILIPLTIFMGMSYFDDKKYYLISILIILETLIPFCIAFESRKPQARELIVISVLCGIGVAGRIAFCMLPQFKPVMALIILAGVCFGAETGFLVGAVTQFVSNFFFGHGPWTPWQMFAFGIIGFVAGIVFRKGWLQKSKVSLSLFGLFSVLILYGGIMNPASVIMWQDEINWKMLASSLVMGIPFDFIHGLSTAFFLWFLSEPMIEKLERIKMKYGLLENKEKE